MSDANPPEIVIEQFSERPAAQISVRASLSEWTKATDQVPVLINWLVQQQAPDAGPLYFRYLRQGDFVAPFDLAIGIVLTEPLPGAGYIEASTVPAGEYATAMHHGHPDQIGAVHQAMLAWIAAKGREIARDEAGAMVGVFEFYLTDPATQPDPAQWETKVAYLLAG